MHYKVLAPLKIDELNLDIDSISIICEKNTIWPMHYDIVISSDGKFFGNSETLFKEKDVLNLKIWVQLDDFNVNTINNIFNALFSLEGENPSVRAKDTLSKNTSYLLSKIMKNSTFCHQDMRHNVLTDNAYLWARSATSFIIEKK